MKPALAGRTLLLVMAVSLFLPAVGCALILDGSKTPEEHTGNIQWGFFLLDILFTGAIGLIIDFATGAMYQRASGGMLQYPPIGKPLAMCPSTTDRAKKTNRATLDGLKRYLESHLGACETCRTALVVQ